MGKGTAHWGFLPFDDHWDVFAPEFMNVSLCEETEQTTQAVKSEKQTLMLYGTLMRH